MLQIIFSRHSNSMLYFSLATCLLLSLTASVNAQDWRFYPQVGVGGEWDDNATLSTRTDDIIDLQGLLLEASASLSYQSGTTRLDFRPLIVDRSYADDPDFDATEVDARLRYQFFGLRSNWRIGGTYNQDTVRRAERFDTDFDITDPDQIPDDDTGLVSLRGDRIRWEFRPSWSYSWSDVSTVSVRLRHRDVTYEDVLLLNDYTDTTLSGDYQLDFSPKTKAFIATLIRHYEADNLAGEYDTKGLTVGLTSQLTAKTQMRLRIGAENIESKITSLEETEPVGELSFIRRLETIQLIAQYRRSMASSGIGLISKRDAVSLNLTRQLGERYEAGFGARGYTDSPVARTSDDQVFGRDYIQLSALFTWNITRTFALRTTYRYTILERANVGESANSNEVTVWLLFRPAGAPNRG
jgi:hypothetical protein